MIPACSNPSATSRPPLQWPSPQHPSHPVVQRTDTLPISLAGYTIPTTGHVSYSGTRQYMDSWQYWRPAQTLPQSHFPLHNTTSSEVQGSSRSSLSSTLTASQRPPGSLPLTPAPQSLPQSRPSSPISSSDPPFLKPLLTVLDTLQAQLSSVQTDVQGAASEIRTVRNAQKRIGERINGLESVFGVSTKRASTKGKSRTKGKGRGGDGGRDNEVRPEFELEAEEPETGLVDACPIPDRLAAIEFAVEELLDRAGKGPPKTVLRDAATSPPPELPGQPVPPLLELRPFQNVQSLDTAATYADLPRQRLPSNASSAQHLVSTTSSPFAPTSELAPVTLSATIGKQYSDASVDACTPPSPRSACTLSFSRDQLSHGFEPVDWSTVLSTNGRSSVDPGFQSAYAAQYLEHFSRHHQLRNSEVQTDVSRFSDGSVTFQQVALPTGQPSTSLIVSMAIPQLSPESVDTRCMDVQMTEDTAGLSVARSELRETPLTRPTREDNEGITTESAPHTIRPISIPILCFGPSSIPSSQDPSLSKVVPSETLTPNATGSSAVLTNVSTASRGTSALQTLPSPPATASPDNPCVGSPPDQFGLRSLGNGPALCTSSSLSETRPSGSLQPPPEIGFGAGLPAEPTISSQASPRSPMIATPPSLTPTPPPTDMRRNGSYMEHSGNQVVHCPVSKPQSRMGSLITPPPPSPSPYTLGQIAEGPKSVVQEDMDSSRDDGLTVGGDTSNLDQESLARPGSDQNAVDVILHPTVVSERPTADISALSATTSPVSAVGARGSINLGREGDPSAQQQTANVACPSPDEITPSAAEDCPPSPGPGAYDLSPQATSQQPPNKSESTPAPSSHTSSPVMIHHMRDLTPTDSQGFAQDEYDVWQTLMLTTPLSVTSLPVLQDASRSPTVKLHEVPRDFPHPQDHLHHPRSEVSDLPGVPPESIFPDARNFRSRSLSPLSSLLSDGEDGAPLGDDEQLSSYISRRRGSPQSKRSEGSLSRGIVETSERRSEPCPYPRQSVTSFPRSASETSTSSRGGPTASLAELARLARREPLKIHIKVPPSLRGIKRNWYGVENGGLMGEAAVGNTSKRVDEQTAVAIDDAPEAENTTIIIAEDTVQADGGSVATSLSGRDHPHANIVTAQSSSATLCASPPHSVNTSMLISATSTLASVEDSASNSAPSAKRLKVEREHAAQGRGTRPYPTKLKSGSNAKPKSKSTPRYFVTGGEVVKANDDPSEISSFQITPAASQPRAGRSDNQGELVEETHRTKRAQKAPTTNHAIKSPSSPTKTVVSRAQKTVLKNASSSRGKRQSRKATSVGEVTWPDLLKTFNKSDLQFIQCDNCDMWYHYGCVGVEVGDPRLEPDAAFICPFCLVQTAKRQTLRGRSDSCARPDCPEVNDNLNDVYVIARVVGRQRLGRAGYRWLVEWEGYPMNQATWIPEGNVFGDGKQLFEKFEADASAEGLDLERGVVILGDAANAGWVEPCNDETM